MDLHNLIPKNFEEQLKCFVCENFLSYFPISTCSNTQNFCGRCTVPEETHFYINTAFETLAQNVKFPCRYLSIGCFEEFTPKDVPNHEENCSYQVKSCPLAQSTKCDWKGPFYECKFHCNEVHADKFMKNSEFEVNLLVSDEDVNLVDYDGKLFIVEKKFDSTDKVLECAIYNYGDDIDKAKYPCHLSVQSCNRTHSIDFSLSSLHKKNFERLSLQLNPRKQDDCGDDAVIGKIKLGEKENPLLVEEKLNFGMLITLLQCSICQDHPGKDICILKSRWAMYCPSCFKNRHRDKEDLISIYDLDKMEVFRRFDYRCKFYKNGCKYVSKSFEFVGDDHQSHCQFEDCKCKVTNCSWAGYVKDLTEHFLNTHKRIAHENIKCFHDWNTTSVIYATYRRNLFKIKCFLNHEKYVWKILSFGKVEKDFKFELELYDESGGKVAVTQKLQMQGHTEFNFEESQVPDFKLKKFKIRFFK